jgi:hypothetical protein
MKTIAGIFLVFAAFISASVFAQNTPSEYALFKKEDNRITEQRNANTISRTKMLKERLVASKTYMPNDRVTMAYITSLIDYSEQLDNKKISQKEYSSLTEARGERFMAAIKDMNDAEDRAFQQAAVENDKIRQEQTNAYNEVIRQQRNAMAGAAALQGIDRSFNNSFGQSITPPPQICNYYGGTRYCY